MFAQMGRLRFFNERQAGEGAGEAIDDGGFIERREFQLWQGGANKVHAANELFQFMVEERQFKKAFAISFSEAAAGRGRFRVTLMFVINDEVVEAHKPDGGHPLVRAVKKMFHLRMDMLGKSLLDPFALHGAREGEQSQVFGTARRNFADRSDDKQ